MRLHLFEFEDLDWFPASLRSGALDYLSFLICALDFYAPALPHISAVTQQQNGNNLVELCAGSGKTSVCTLRQKLKKKELTLFLTDKFPQTANWKELRNTCCALDFSPEPTDILKANSAVRGAKIMFSAAHHFRPQELREVIKAATSANEPLILLDGGMKSLFLLPVVPLVHLPLSFLVTPFLKPFRISNLLFCWFIPLIPLVATWDGIVSVLRLYSAEQLAAIAAAARPDYRWTSSTLKSTLGLRLTCLVGTWQSSAGVA